MKSMTSKTTLRAGWLAACIIPAVVMLSEAAAWWWMNPSSSGGEVALLSYRFPDERPGHVRKPLDAAIARALKCDAGQIGTIEMKGGRRVDVSFFEWDGTDEKGLMEAFGHSPDVCMGVSGFEVDGYLPGRTFEVDGQSLVFDVTRFLDRRGDPFFIFKAPWAEGTWGLNLLREGPQGASFRAFKFDAVRHRWKPRFSRVMMGGVAGFQNEEDAWNLFSETVLKDLEIKATPLGSP
jgi:hypothetical protein